MRKELTPREIEVLRLVGRGASNDQIASALTLSSRTVANHLRSAFEKLGVNDRKSAFARMVIRYPEYQMTMEQIGFPAADRGVNPAPTVDPKDTEVAPLTTLYGLYAGLGKFRTPASTGVSRLALILRVAGAALIFLAALAGLLSVFQIFDPGTA